jgi:ABC-2 type transport system permease protein
MTAEAPAVPAAATAGVPGALRRAIHAEWTKVRTTAGAAWLVIGAVVLTVGVSALTTAAVRFQADGGQDAVRISLTGVQAGQAVVAVLAVLAISGEHSNGLLQATLLATPRRHVALVAKAAVVAGLVAVAGVAGVLGSVAAGHWILPTRGFTAANGAAGLSLADGPTLRAVAGSVLYLVLVALLSLGVATAVRDSAAAMGAVLGLLYLSPIVAGVIADERWAERVQRYTPTTAGLSIQATVDLRSLPIGPWPGLGVLAAWTLAALAGGAVLLHARDV